MWQIYAMEALELARERQREADAARLARTAAFHSEREHRPSGGRVIRVGRRLAVDVLRRLGTGAGSVADAAYAAASRLERGAA